MRNIVLFVLILSLLLTSACLKRNNPLDPSGNAGIGAAPENVSNLVCVGSVASNPQKFVRLNWDVNSDETTSGYYVYRGFSYNSDFARVGTVESNTGQFIHTETNGVPVMPGRYWYQVSGFKDHYDPDSGQYWGRLEGRRTSPAYVEVK
ncbi:MAG: hypothetical protein QM233_01070 [Candidatus Cloacimonadota bacterium]|jgi:hypothetical protein|nr:hypothetical protein [Candidatus Cloacimonadota bacterium]